MWINTAFPSTPGDLSGHPYKELQGKIHRWWRGSAFSMRPVNYLNKCFASVVRAPSANILVGIRLDRDISQSLSTMQLLTDRSSPQLPTASPYIHIPPANIKHFIMLPDSLSCSCGFFRPLMACV